MKSNKLINFLGRAETFTKKNSPVILTGMTIAGVISTAIAAYKAGLKADEVLKIYREDMRDCHPNDKEAKRAVVKETAKRMIPVAAPPIIMGGTTIACAIGSHSVSNRRIAALSAAYSLSESTVKSLHGKMDEMLGEKKARSIRDAVMKDKLHSDTEKDQKTINDNNFIMVGGGDVLCKDIYSGRLFYSNAEKIKQAIAKCSYEIISNNYLSLNEFYAEINSPQLPQIPMGNDLGWNASDVYKGQLPIYLTPLLTEDNRPCLCVDYDISVRNDFRNLH